MGTRLSIAARTSHGAKEFDLKEAEMNLSLGIVPGRSIGPFQLGMTALEIEEALRTLSPESPLTLEALGIVAWSRDSRGWTSVEGSNRCEHLGIRVYNNDHTILLMGQQVNNISNEDAIRLFESFGGKLSHSYGGFDAVEVGIDAVRWENSDPWIDSIFVMPPGARPR